MTDKFVNHWGKWVNSEVPVTGVQGINTIPEWVLSEDGIALGCEECEARKECRECTHPEDCLDCTWEHNCDCCENQGPYLLGTWRKDQSGRYEPDPAGEYAAILREDVVQVVQSKYTRRAALCSPCYPGQADLDTPGEFLAYCLPED